MSRSFHVTRKNFKGCSKKEIGEMIEDEFSEFSEWVYKKHVKKSAIEKRKFKNAFVQLVQNESFSADEVSRLDDRDYFYKILHSRIFK